MYNDYVQPLRKNERIEFKSSEKESFLQTMSKYYNRKYTCTIHLLRVCT